MKVVICGLTITSAWGNGHATTFRSLVKALTLRGHQVLFIEKDVEWYRNNRDLPHPPFCSLELYDHWELHESRLLKLCRDADAIVIGSYFPDAIAAMNALKDAAIGPLLFYDIDTPITLRGLHEGTRVAYLDAAMIPHFDAYLSFTGGSSLRELEERFGARRALPFYCSVDPDLYKPTPVREEFRCDLSYLGTYAPDRQPKLMHLLNASARLLSEFRFIVAGAMYPPETEWAENVIRYTHVSPPQHPSFFSSTRFSLNLTRDEMVLAGYSPSVRLFEASACGAVMLSDYWAGLEEFLSPGKDILIPNDNSDVAYILRHLSERERTQIGANARERILAQHTSLHRAIQFEGIVGGLVSATGNETTLRTTEDGNACLSSSVIPANRRL